jgi:F0F1-type ATP synthase assembly protein I
MGKISLYFDHFIREIGLYFDHFIRESGILLFIVILLGMILTVFFVWQKIKIKKVQADFFQNRAFED